MKDVRFITAVSLSVIVCMLFSCAPLRPRPPAGSKTVIRDVPFYPENRNWCGPASLAGVMNYWRDSVQPHTIARKTYSATAGGTLMADLAWFARNHGFKVQIKTSNISELRKAVDRGQPVIVFVGRGSFFGTYNHFMVVVGYTPDGFIVNSGLRSHQYITTGTLQSYWKQNGNYALFVKPDRNDPNST